jgi:hypothetical protein
VVNAKLTGEVKMGLKDFKKAMAKVNEQDLAPKEEAAKSFKDDRFWLPQFDDTGVAKATIRFLGNPVAGEAPWVLDLNHSYEHKTPQGSKWFIERCSWSIKKPCPVCAYVNEIGYDNIKGLSKKKFYISNILVITDNFNKENEGKVFLYKFGSQIFNTITQCQGGYKSTNEDGEEVDIKPRKVFNFDEGHDFNIHVYKKKADGKDQNQYDKCKFKMKKSAVAGGDEEEQEKIYNAMYSFKEFTDESGFKSEEELSKRLEILFKKNISSDKPKGEEKTKVVEKKTITPTKTEDEEDDDFFNDLDDDEIPY